MKQSARCGTQLQFHRNELYVQTDSCKLWNAKLDDRNSGFCSNRSVEHQTTSYRLFSVFYIGLFKR